MKAQLQKWPTLEVRLGESPKHIFKQTCTPGNNPEECELDVPSLMPKQKAPPTLPAQGLCSHLYLLQVVSFGLMADLQAHLGKVTELAKMVM